MGEGWKRAIKAAKATRLKRKPLRKKSPARKLAQKIDLAVRERVFERDGYRCVYCLKGPGGVFAAVLQAAHILPKGRYPRMRFVEENILTLCIGCHLFWAHRDPVGFSRWMESAYPGLYDRLLVMAATSRKIDLKELAIVYGVGGTQ